jgi:hypothetical protein
MTYYEPEPGHIQRQGDIRRNAMNSPVSQVPDSHPMHAAAERVVAVQDSPAQDSPAQIAQFEYRPVRRSAPMVHIRHLELAPEGWRLCVGKIAEGFAEIIGEHAYCLNCGGVLDGKQGHDVTCLTMVARRILANEPLLHAKRKAALEPQARDAQFPGVDIDALHTRA